MEGILFITPVSAAAAVIGGTFVFGSAVAVAILSRLADDEAGGVRHFWAEWPLPEARKEEPAEVERVRLAA